MLTSSVFNETSAQLVSELIQSALIWNRSKAHLEPTSLRGQHYRKAPVKSAFGSVPRYLVHALSLPQTNQASSFLVYLLSSSLLRFSVTYPPSSCLQLAQSMRLLNTKTLKLEEFFPSVSHKYGILSHRWGNPADEVTFEDFERKVHKRKKSWPKIKGYCKMAKASCAYVWVDTCCIDKRSSAELQEAINSMFQWYKASAMCHVFMEDVNGLDNIEKSLWFSRGWTLQELLAPQLQTFYDKDWKILGTRQSLARHIENATGIETQYLNGDDAFSSASVATKMHWASPRTTTRLEDKAYSLLGLFGVSLPIIYGEGERAFDRLQEEIIRSSDDQSLFAWDAGVGGGSRRMLAPSPDGFDRKDMSDQSTLVMQMLRNVPSAPQNQDTLTTNLGIRIYLPISRISNIGVTNVGRCPLTHQYDLKVDERNYVTIITLDRSEVTATTCDGGCEKNSPPFFMGLLNCSTTSEGTVFILMRKILGTSKRYEKVYISGYCFTKTVPEYCGFNVLYVR